MSVRTKKSFAWLWVAALLSSTVGVSMHTIYCYCTDRITLTFFEPAGSECAPKKKSEPAACCSKKTLQKKSYHPAGDFSPTQWTCSTDESEAASTVPNCTLEGDNKGCTQKSTVVFQLKTEYLVEKPFEKDFEFPLWLEEMPFLKRLARPALCEVPCQLPVAEPPPPESGRGLCIRYQCFLC